MEQKPKLEKKKKEKKASVKFEDLPTDSDATVLVVPPLALDNGLYDKIKKRYNVHEAMKLEASVLKDASTKLVLASSFDGVLEIKKQCAFKLVVYGLSENSKKSCADNYYLGLDDFYANDKLRQASFSGATIRSHVDKMLKSMSQI